MTSIVSLARNLLGQSTQGDLKLEDSQPSDISQDRLSSYPTTTPFAIGQVLVSRICIFPIKSCKGTDVPEARYSIESFENDRKWGVIDANTHKILTARQVPKMVLITPRIQTDSASPHGGVLEVSFPPEAGCDTFTVPLNPSSKVLESWETIDDGSVNGQFTVDGYICRSLSLDDTPSQILSHYFKRPVHLMMKGPDPRACPPTSAFPTLDASTLYQDAYPLHVAIEESIEEFERVVRMLATNEQTAIGGLDRERWSQGGVLMDRFRPNVILKGAGVPFAEDFWREITIGPPSGSDPGRPPMDVTFVMKCTRCLLPNVDPDIGVRDAAVPFKVLMKFRTGMFHEAKNKPCFGTYGVFGGSGVVKVGDVISVKEWTDANGV